MNPSARRWLAPAVPASCLLLLAAFWVHLGLRNWVYVMMDYARYVERANGIVWTRPETMYSVMKPFGYPALLRFLFAFVRDYRIAGIGLSVASAAITLVALDILWRRFGIGFQLRTLALVVVGLERLFVDFAILPGTDMLHLALVTLACLPLCKKNWSRSDVFLTGLIVGFGFLNRYRMPVFLLAPMLRILFTRPGFRSKATWISLLFLGFLLPASLQFGVNAAATGNPFASNTLLTVYFLNQPNMNYWDVWTTWFGGHAPVQPRLGWWLLAAVPRNIPDWFAYIGHGFHVWAFLAIPGVWSMLRASRGEGWSPLRCYLLVNAVLLCNLFLIPAELRFALFLVPPMVLAGLWFIAREVLPNLRWTPPARRSVGIAAAGCLVIWLGTWDVMAFGEMAPYAKRNLEIDRTLGELGIEPQTSLLQVGTGFYECRNPLPLFYPIHGGVPPGSELTLERLKDILSQRQRSYLLFGKTASVWSYPHLWILLSDACDDPDLTLLKIWKGEPPVSLYRYGKKSPVGAASPDGESRPEPAGVTNPDLAEKGPSS